MGLFSNEDQGKKWGLFTGKKLQEHLPPIDYSQYSEKDLFLEFKGENWSKRSNESKIAVLQEIEKREAEAHNREAATVIPINGGGCLGGYTSGKHTIEIRLTDNQFEDLDTLFHESEHANQSKSSMEYVNFSENDKKLMQIEDMKSSDERNSHYNKYSIPLYEVMTSELDANNAAIEKMSSLKEEFKYEAKYQMYLEGRQNYYANLADKIALNMNKKAAALLDTVGFAYKNNELSEEEYNELQNIIGKEGYDMCEKRSLEIDESMSPVNLQDKADIENLSLERNSQEEIFKANDEVEAVENVETEEAGMEEKNVEELAKEEAENEENGSAMLKELENSEVEDINFGEESVMIDYLDSGDENILIENESAIIEDLGELENIDNSSSESNDYSSSGDIGMD